MMKNKQIKSNNNLIIHFFFLCLFFLHLASIYKDWASIQMLTKPLICLSLLISLATSKNLNTNYQKLIAIGLFFGLLGDVFLMFKDLFILGLIAFLLGHVCYILAFLIQKSKNSILKDIPSIILLVLLLTYSYYFYTVLSPSLGSLKIPVIIYIIGISSMCYFAFQRSVKRSTINFLLGFLGSLLFIISDSVLALNKFVAYIPSSGLVIMSTYMLAQYFIFSTALFKTTSVPPSK